MILLRVLAGSRLYGTHGPDSDWDFYEVHDKIRTRQRKTGGEDTIRIGLSHWIRLAEKGTHQALDAMWAPPEYAEIDVIRDFRLNFRPDPWRARDQLYRTAEAMEHSRRSEKRDKHAARLRHCGDRVYCQGWYDPTEWGRLIE